MEDSNRGSDEARGLVQELTKKINYHIDDYAEETCWKTTEDVTVEDIYFSRPRSPPVTPLFISSLRQRGEPYKSVAESDGMTLTGQKKRPRLWSWQGKHLTITLIPGEYAEMYFCDHNDTTL